MVLKGISKRLLFMLALLFIATQISFGCDISVAAEDSEHTYVIFQDDFEDGKAEDWTINISDEAPLGSSWAVEQDDGNYVFRSWGQTWAEAGDYSWTNYTFEVKVKMLSSTGGAQMSVRRIGPIGPSRYFVRFSCFITKEYMGNFTDVEHTRVVFHANRWYDFKIVCIGNNIRVYIDDMLKLDYVDEDNPILSGKIVLEGSPDSHIYFDDVKVSTTHRLYVKHIIQEAQNEINKAKMIEAETTEAEQKLAQAQAAFSEGDLSSAESLTKEAINLAQQAPAGTLSVSDLLKYSAEYDRRTVEISGTIRDIRYDQGIYTFAIDDGTGVISATFNGTLGEIKTDDEVGAIGIFDASTVTVTAETLEKVKPPMEGLFTFLIFKDDFEDGDFRDWSISINPEIEGSAWNIEKEGDNNILSGEGHCWSMAGDTDWADYIFEFKIKQIKGMVQINFRLTQKPPEGEERYILRLFHYAPSLAIGEIYLKEQRYRDLKFFSASLESDIWYAVKIVCLGNNIKIYIDDDLKIDYTDEEYPLLSGSIGLEPVPYDDSKPSTFYFDDIKVSKIATTSDINDLITYAQSEIDEAKEINADVSAAELKLEQAKQALVQDDYKIVQYMVDEAVWLAKRASLGEISIKDLWATATKCSGHIVIIKGTVESLQARYGAGYDFTIEDGTGGIAVTYQGALVDIGDKYEVKVTGVFDAASETVSASRIEKISVPSTPAPSIPTGPLGISLSIEQIATLISISGAGIGAVGWIVKTQSTRRRKKVLFKKLMNEIDDIYSRFKMNSIQCEAELYKLKDEALNEFKEGMIDEDNYNTLDKRIEDYMKEIRDQIEKEKLSR